GQEVSLVGGIAEHGSRTAEERHVAHLVGGVGDLPGAFHLLGLGPFRLAQQRHPDRGTSSGADRHTQLSQEIPPVHVCRHVLLLVEGALGACSTSRLIRLNLGSVKTKSLSPRAGKGPPTTRRVRSRASRAASATPERSPGRSIIHRLTDATHPISRRRRLSRSHPSR